jgi:hypothetical protein
VQREGARVAVGTATTWTISSDQASGGTVILLVSGVMIGGARDRVGQHGIDLAQAAVEAHERAHVTGPPCSSLIPQPPGA